MTYTILSLACAAGAGSGLARLKVWVVVPTSVIFMLAVVILGNYSDLTWDRIALTVFGVVTTLQISYLIGSALAETPQAQPIPDRTIAKQELLHAAQTAIGEELRAYFLPLPLSDVSPQLRNKLALLEGR